MTSGAHKVSEQRWKRAVAEPAAPTKECTKVGVLPEWTKDLPGHTLIGTIEICQVFGRMHRGSVTDAVKFGWLPKPTLRIRSHGGKMTYRWRLADVRKFCRAA